jgi:hypothetical protein
MDTNVARNELKVMVVMDLAAICKKVADNPAVPDDLREEARELIEEFDYLLPFRGRGDPGQHEWGETLLVKMARFLPKMNQIQSWPADARKL